MIKDYDKYKKFGIRKNILDQYENESEFILFNEEDKDLDTIRVDLPKTPLWNEIENFGLPAKEQFFRRESIPAKIISLQEMTTEKGEALLQEEIWDLILEQPEFYEDEIRWIKLQQKRLLIGYWVFINGKASYIDGWHYRYLNFYNLDIGAPEYRDRDRRFFIFARFCKVDPDSFGFLYPKHRREGATYKTSCIHYDIITTGVKVRGGIQSMTDESANDVYSKHIIDPWREMPFFLKPNHNGGDDPKKVLQFRASSSRGKAGIRSKGKSLGSEITFRASGEKQYDGTKLYFYHHEECAKATNVDINKRWEVAQLCLSTGGGSKIHGFSIHTSTVGEMELGGGEQFRELCENSMYSKRNKNNRTASGLYILFMPAWDGLEGFIDEYGMSIIQKPTKEQSEYINKDVGAKEYIENTIEYLKTLTKKDKLLQFQREHPTSFRGCFRSNATNPFFDIPLIEDRLDELRLMPNAVVRGYFEWKDPNNPYRSGVNFIEDPEGRFSMSKILPIHETNRVTWDFSIESFVPNNLQYCAGSDPFKANQVKNKKGSDGGGAVFWGHEILKDPYQKPYEDWISNRFICTYKHRPDIKEEYGDDMIMMCIYFGCPMYTETQVPFIREYFIEKGFGGMLVHTYNNGKHDALAGEATTEKTKQKIFNEFRTHIKRHCKRELHSDILTEIRDIRDPADMTNWDLFTAGGYAMVGILNYWADLQKEQQEQDNENNVTFDQLFKQRQY